jgi:predicted nucleic acid-binding protein
MILVDSSVWITLFRGENTAQTYCLRELLQNGEEEVAIADLILLEVLQGVLSEQQAQSILESVNGLACPILGGKPLAILAAGNYRQLRKKGFTIRSTIDCLIATFCIEHDFPLLHNDRDFVPFQQHLGLRTVES